jgi:hypothetical protein
MQPDKNATRAMLADRLQKEVGLPRAACSDIVDSLSNTCVRVWRRGAL